MRRSVLEEIRSAIRRGEFDMTAHAFEEMGEDELDLFEVEAAILSGSIMRIEKDDPPARGILFSELRLTD